MHCVIHARPEMVGTTARYLRPWQPTVDNRWRPDGKSALNKETNKQTLAKPSRPDAYDEPARKETSKQANKQTAPEETNKPRTGVSGRRLRLVPGVPPRLAGYSPPYRKHTYGLVSHAVGGRLARHAKVGSSPKWDRRKSGIAA